MYFFRLKKLPSLSSIVAFQLIFVPILKMVYLNTLRKKYKTYHFIFPCRTSCKNVEECTSAHNFASNLHSYVFHSENFITVLLEAIQRHKGLRVEGERSPCSKGIWEKGVGAFAHCKIINFQSLLPWLNSIELEYLPGIQKGRETRKHHFLLSETHYYPKFLTLCYASTDHGT